MNATTYWTEVVKSPAGRALGYVVTDRNETLVAKFMNRDWPSWRVAKDKAHRLADMLNTMVELGSVS